MIAAIECRDLGRRYRSRWALTDCTLRIPPGRVVGLVGPNGAGKTTLLNLITGHLAPSTGTIDVLGDRPGSGPEHLAKVGFVAQDTPTYPGLSIADHLRLGARLNPRWDRPYADQRIARLGLDPKSKAGRHSGGQRAQLALTMAIAKRPELLILDEPVASLDPLARREFLDELTNAVADRATTVMLSSHLVSDLEGFCDYLVVIADSRIQAAGPVDDLLAAHHALTVHDADRNAPAGSHNGSATTLEDLVLTHMGRVARPEVETRK